MPSLMFMCPNCKEKAEYDVIKTEPSHYYWSKEKTTFFEKLVGQDIFYRKRVKWCHNCKVSFKTIEMSEMYLSALINEIDRLESSSSNLKNKMHEIAETILKTTS